MRRILFLILAMLILNSTCVLAVTKDNLPIYDDFDAFDDMPLHRYATGYITKIQNAKNHYSKIENKKMKIQINSEESGAVTVSKMLETPFAGEKFEIEYDFSISGNPYLYSLVGFPMFVDSEGVKTAAMKITNAKQGYTVPGDRQINVNQNSLKNTVWKADVQYKINIKVDLNEKIFEIYIDEGNGYEKKETVSGESKFKYSGKNFAGFYFSFLGNKTNEAAYYIDNIKVSTGYDYVYVSPNGNDNNDGSFENPVKTPEQAYLLAEKKKSLNNKNVFVKVKSGEYDINQTYSLGTIDENTEYKKIAFVPDNNSDIAFRGDFNIEIPELENFPDEILKERFKKDIKENYISGYNNVPLEISDISMGLSEDGKFGLSMWLGNSGRIKNETAVIMAVYDKNGRLIDTKMNNYVLGGGEKKKASVEMSIKEEYADYTVKSYIWSDSDKMIPIFNMNISPELQSVIKNTRITNVKSCFVDGKIDLSGIASPGDFITVKLTGSNGNIIYINQLTADETGQFEDTAVPQYIPYGTVTLHISSNGGVNNE